MPRTLREVVVSPDVSIQSEPEVIAPSDVAVLSLKAHPMRLGESESEVFVYYSGIDQPERFRVRLQVEVPSHLKDSDALTLQWREWQTSGLLVSASAGATEPDALLVDIRPTGEFQRAHAAGAFNLDLLALERSPLLEGRKVLIMDRGATHIEVMERLAALREKGGHDLRVIDGGLRAWHAAGGKLEGPSVHDAALYTLTPAEVIACRGRAGWKFTSVDDGAEAFQLGRVVPLAPESPESSGDITIVISARGDHYQTFNDQLQQPNRAVFYASGGASGITDYLRTADRELNPRRITYTGASMSPGRSREIPRSGGGCCGS